MEDERLQGLGGGHPSRPFQQRVVRAVPPQKRADYFQFRGPNHPSLGCHEAHWDPHVPPRERPLLDHHRAQDLELDRCGPRRGHGRVQARLRAAAGDVQWEPVVHRAGQGASVHGLGQDAQREPDLLLQATSERDGVGDEVAAVQHVQPHEDERPRVLHAGQRLLRPLRWLGRGQRNVEFAHAGGRVSSGFHGARSLRSAASKRLDRHLQPSERVVEENRSAHLQHHRVHLPWREQPIAPEKRGEGGAV
mmetsp:Transcript_5230/g.13005  ORF Transcript_5230/g.13005 Transcript_5230/m.13005 type:complete len:249 (-) Transcript_5230:2280-3026(-)